MGKSKKEHTNITSYKDVQDSLNISQEPYLSFQVGRQEVWKNVNNLLNYEGIGELRIPGSFLNVVPKIMNLPVMHIIELLKISKSTYYRVKEEDVLEMDTVDKLASILKVYQRGVESFGNKEDFQDWLYTKVITIGGKKPIDLLKTENGRLAVLDAIDRVEHGIYG
jgi:putative toxin-antitoxin system antitoxin component (TIGR02293 family)